MRAEFGDAEAGHRFIKQQQLRFGGEGYGELQLALLTMTQFGYDDIGAMSEPDAIERGLRGSAQVAFFSGIAPETKRVAVMGLRCQRDIVERTEVGQ